MVRIKGGNSYMKTHNTQRIATQTHRRSNLLFKVLILGPVKKGWEDAADQGTLWQDGSASFCDALTHALAFWLKALTLCEDHVPGERKHTPMLSLITSRKMATENVIQFLSYNLPMLRNHLLRNYHRPPQFPQCHVILASTLETHTEAGVSLPSCYLSKFFLPRWSLIPKLQAVSRGSLWKPATVSGNNCTAKLISCALMLGMHH